ncbi:methyl-accepting chemotaxis protein [Janthinobacterium fluminis]|uniref:Methyl-accepting chemotaxis protein n=1 Tax=Janthinobacterium fluminis TaxID=2987524 RepID=A0ABT5K369_9BURK|nr:methyl-accepting chemotaxis protein [Janthinobacterium fluminis]MDC8759423.1 methyl-accepting chemotaxis protein [Janthinobacterium fluminis]
MRFTNMNIGTRLNLAFGLVLSFLIGIVILGTVSLAQLNAGTAKIVELDWVKAKLGAEALDNVRGSIARVFQIVDTTGDADEKGARERLDANELAFTAALAKLEPLLYVPAGKALLGKARGEGERYVAAYKKALALYAAGDHAAASKQAHGETFAALHVFADTLRDFNLLQQKLVEDSGAQSRSRYEAARAFLIALGVMAAALGCVCAWLVSRSITRPLGEAVRIAQTVAAGDLTSRIDVRSSDETGQLLQALKEMNDSLLRIVGQVRAGTDSIATGSSEIASGNLDLSARTEQQASALEETASAVEELTSTVKQNGDNARQANQLAGSASEVAVKGGQVVSQVVQTMGAINDSAKKIVDIIGVIDGIAFQTNILALNAAVEAARAGEQGRGFAVVASEVRNLAQRSAGAAKEIKELIGDSVEKVEAGSKLVNQAGSTMDDIVASVQRVTDIMGEISSASREQEVGIEQIHQAITEMDGVTQQNAALVEEAAAAAGSLNDQAASLAQAVSVFKLAGMQAAAPQARAPASAPAPAAAPARPVLKRPGPLRIAAPAVKKVAAPAGASDEWEEF